MNMTFYKRMKTNEPILLQIGTSGPRDKGMKRSTLGVRRPRVDSGAWRRHHSRPFYVE